MKCFWSIKSFSLKATAISTVAFFVFSGTSVPVSFADPNELTLNEAQRTVATLTLEQANAQTVGGQNTIPSGVAIQQNNPLSAIESLPINNEPQTAGRIFNVHQGESIQSAIDQAQAGDTVYLFAGSYHEALVMKQGVNLTGEDSKTTILNGQGTLDNVIIATGNNRIEGLTITGAAAYNGWPHSAIQVTGDDVRITGNIIKDNADYAVYLRSGQNTVIEYNLFLNNYLAIQHPLVSAGNALIRYNTMVNNQTGINLLGGVTPRIENNIITGSTFCAIYEFSWDAWAIGQLSRGFSTVANNVFFNNAWYPTYYTSSTPPAVENLTSGNTIANPQFNNPASGDYSVPENSPGFGRGAFIPEILKFALERADSVRERTGTTYRIEEIRVSQQLTGWRFVYSEGSVETFYKDGTKQWDTTPPAIEILSTTTLTNQTAYAFRYTIDGVEHVENRTLTEGQNTLTVQASDIFGNTAVQNLNVRLDTSAAAAFTWIYNGIGTNLWSIGTNWLGGVAPGALDTAIFGPYAIADCVIDAVITVLNMAFSSDYTGTITQQANVSVTNNFSQAGGHWVDSNPMAHTFNVGGSFAISEAAGAFNRYGDQVSGAYQVRDVYDLQAMNGFLTSNFKLAGDIDASRTVNWNSGAGFNPVGTYNGSHPEYAFSGIFDGSGHTISSLTINRPMEDYVGLFGSRTGGLSISNVGLLNANIIGNAEVGGLVGGNTGNISDSYVTGAVTGQSCIGGLVGQNFFFSTISNSYFAGVVTGSGDLIGGLVGVNVYHSDISNSYATGTVTGQNYVGGLVGVNHFWSFISNSYATGTVTGTNKVGGLVGDKIVYIDNDYSSVSNSYFTDGVHDNGFGTYESGGAGAFYGSHHAVYDQTGTNPWNFSSIWDSHSYVLPHLKWEHFTGVPPGWTRATSNPNFALRLTPAGNGFSFIEYKNLTTNSMGQVPFRVYGTIQDFDMSGDGTTVSFHLPGSTQSYSYQLPVVVNGVSSYTYFTVANTDSSTKIRTQVTSVWTGVYRVEAQIFRVAYQSVSTGTLFSETGLTSWPVFVPRASSSDDLTSVYEKINPGQTIPEVHVFRWGSEDVLPVTGYENIRFTNLSDLGEVLEVIYSDGRSEYYNPATLHREYPLPQGWTRTTSNPDYAFGVQEDGLFKKMMVLNLSNGQQTEVAELPVGGTYPRFQDIAHVSPDGFTVIYGTIAAVGNATVYVQRLSDPAKKFSSDGVLQSITFVSNSENIRLNFQDGKSILLRWPVSPAELPQILEERKPNGVTSYFNVSDGALERVKIQKDEGLEDPLPSVEIVRPLIIQAPSPLNQRTIKFIQAMRGVRYEIQFRTSIASGNWQTAGSFVADRYGEVSWQDPLGDRGSPCFYRVVAKEMTTAADLLTQINLLYFDPAFGMIETTHGYPLEGWIQRDKTQPSNFGFYAYLLATIAAGDLVTSKISKTEAISRLNTMMDHLLLDQADLNIGFLGLLPWLEYTGSDWRRMEGSYGHQVSFEDNTNFTNALAVAYGALLDESLANNSAVHGTGPSDGGILGKINTFIANQEVGYSAMYNTGTQTFAQTMQISDRSLSGGIVLFGAESSAPLLFLILQYGDTFPASAYAKLNFATRTYRMQDLSFRTVVAPFSGAFQMYWPALLMPESENSDLRDMLENYTDVQLDFANRNGQPGLLSASYDVVSDNLLNRTVSAPFSWMGDDVRGAWEGGHFRVTSSTNAGIGIAFTDGYNKFALEGSTMQLRYSSTTAVPNARIEFKKRLGGVLTTVYTEVLSLENTGGAERMVSFTLPLNGVLGELTEVVFATAGGGALDVVLYSFATDRIGYNFPLGINEIATGGATVETTPSVYNLGAAYMFRPAQVEALLQGLIAAHPGLVSAHGLWEGLNMIYEKIVHEQVFNNVVTFALGMANVGSSYMTRYLENKGQTAELESIWNSQKPVSVIKPDNATNFSYSDGPIAYKGTSWALNESVRASDRQIRITYQSNTAIKDAKFDLKYSGSGNVPVYSVLFDLPATGGVPGEVILTIPENFLYWYISEMVVVFPAAAGFPSALISRIVLAPEGVVMPPAVVVNAGTPHLIKAKTLMVNYTLDGVAKTKLFEGLAEGVNTLAITAADVPGLQTPVTFNVTVDTIAPVVTLYTDTPSVIETTSLTVYYTTEGAVKQKVFTGLAVGNNTLSITETDLAGNQTTVNWIVKLDDTGHCLLRGPLTIFPMDGGNVSSSWESDHWHIASTNYQEIGIAAIVSGLDATGHQLQIRYSLVGAFPGAVIEFKKRYGGVLQRSFLATLPLENTGGKVRTMTLFLPSDNHGTDNLDEVVFLISGGGGSLDMSLYGFTLFEPAPAAAPTALSSSAPSSDPQQQFNSALRSLAGTPSYPVAQQLQRRPKEPSLEQQIKLMVESLKTSFNKLMLKKMSKREAQQLRDAWSQAQTNLSSALRADKKINNYQASVFAFEQTTILFKEICAKLL